MGALPQADAEQVVLLIEQNIQQYRDYQNSFPLVKRIFPKKDKMPDCLTARLIEQVRDKKRFERIKGDEAKQVQQAARSDADRWDELASKPKNQLTADEIAFLYEGVPADDHPTVANWTRKVQKEYLNYVGSGRPHLFQIGAIASEDKLGKKATVAAIAEVIGQDRAEAMVDAALVAINSLGAQQQAKAWAFCDED